MLVTRDYAHAVRIGADGSRDFGSPDIRERNIVVVGDSFTSNLGIEDPSNVFTEVLEQRLRTHNVINLGVNGYGTAQEYLKLKQAMPQYQPDIVMLMFYVRNDFYDNVELFRWMSGYERCSAPGFLDSGLKVITSTLPRPARRNRVALGLDSDSRTSPASTARCTSVETRARRGGVPRSFRSSAPTRDSPLPCG